VFKVKSCILIVRYACAEGVERRKQKKTMPRLDVVILPRGVAAKVLCVKLNTDREMCVRRVHKTQMNATRALFGRYLPLAAAVETRRR
jgi:hypothetical protein